jgi:hypothetical protein
VKLSHSHAKQKRKGNLGSKIAKHVFLSNCKIKFVENKLCVKICGQDQLNTILEVLFHGKLLSACNFLVKK